MVEIDGFRERRVSGVRLVRRGALLIGVGLVCLLAAWARPVLAQVRATYLYNLSDFSGRLRDDWARVRVDEARDETYVIYQSLIRVFNPSGMEVFRFGEDLDLGQILDLAVAPNGDLVLLSYKDSRSLVTRCNYRGVPVGPIDVKGLPAGMPFGANRMVLRNGLFYFASLSTSSVIVTTAEGEFRKQVELLRALDVEQRQMEGAETIGFTVDLEGNILFTVPVLFKVCRLSPDGKLTSFGRSGSAPGRFGILGGVESDARGHLLVADKLKCVVMVFDRDFNFLTEFGYRGARPENLVVPDDLAVDRRNRVYVSQGRRRGISVFSMSGD